MLYEIVRVEYTEPSMILSEYPMLHKYNPKSSNDRLTVMVDNLGELVDDLDTKIILSRGNTGLASHTIIIYDDWYE